VPTVEKQIQSLQVLVNDDPNVVEYRLLEPRERYGLEHSEDAAKEQQPGERADGDKERWQTSPGQDLVDDLLINEWRGQRGDATEQDERGGQGKKPDVRAQKTEETSE
jgi:hypothetical protein